MQELTTVELRPEAGEGLAGSANFSPPVVATRPKTTQSATPLRHRLPAAASQLLRAGMRMLGEEVDHGRLLLFSPVFLGAGSAGWFLAASDFPLVASLLCLLALTVAVLVAGRSRAAVRATLLALSLVACGMVAAQFESRRASTVILDSAVTTTVTGRVERREGDGRGRWRYILAVTGTEAPQVKRPPGRITAIARGADAPFEIGDIITGRARLTPPAGPALPGLNDFSFSAYFDGIGANGFFYGAPTKVDAQAGSQVARSTTEALLEWLYRLRSGIGDRIRSILPGDTGAFAAALVTDERRAISDATTEALRQSGLAHIIAISGLNMALSAGIFFVGLRMLLSLFPGVAEAYPTKKIAAAGALITVTAYFLISGFAVSAERAFIMMAIMLIAVFFDRPSISLRNVALSALVIIIISPSEVLGPSFQMSFAATLALVSGYQLWKDRRVRENAFLKLPMIRPFVTVAGFFGGVFLTSLIGGFSTALFSIEHFSSPDRLRPAGKSRDDADHLLHHHAGRLAGDAAHAFRLGRLALEGRRIRPRSGDRGRKDGVRLEWQYRRRPLARLVFRAHRGRLSAADAAPHPVAPYRHIDHRGRNAHPAASAGFPAAGPGHFGGW